MFLVDLARLARAAYVLAREGVATVLPFPEPRPLGLRIALVFAALIQRRGTAVSGAERLTAAVNRLGPSYVKLGQFLATRPDVVGRSMADDLTALQDNLPAFGLDGAKAAIRLSFGVEPDRVYTALSEPIAAASIAQVHKGKVRDRGDDRERAVAVKVLRPGVERRFASDLGGFYLAARLIERLHKASRRLKPLAVVDTLARSVSLEMDFRLEAAALSEMAENTRDDPGFRVPSVDWERSSRTVLTMEWIDGRKLSDVEGIRADGHDMKALAATLIQSFLRHAIRDGFFHADMHQGNLFVDAEGRIVAVDFGIMGRLGAEERRFLAEILYGFITRDYRRVARVHFEAGYVPPDQDMETFAQALRAVGEPLQGHKASEISMARLLTQLFEVTELFQMETRPELIMLQKTMVVVEGVARSLDPELDMWKSAEPVVTEWVARNLGPIGQAQRLFGHLGAIAALGARLPALADDFSRLAASLTAPPPRRHWPPLLAAPLWIIALALVWIAVHVI
ncbi:2-polyprenylphenol 6-hydroxylase [Oryzibacter oryziterrae]|uniref:2-polyprenylphenol 6-hydroxylase n=1 Tax=Oryzibacter oryziterrae TaxID=2766474 RepID=UPI001F00A1C3|nr:2-polyprenylphenol 6-hydroxylase [Oryzibacter oryziterrae]